MPKILPIFHFLNLIGLSIECILSADPMRLRTVYAIGVEAGIGVEFVQEVSKMKLSLLVQRQAFSS